jgi:hypothetical protein
LDIKYLGGKLNQSKSVTFNYDYSVVLLLFEVCPLRSLALPSVEVGALASGSELPDKRERRRAAAEKLLRTGHRRDGTATAQSGGLRTLAPGFCAAYVIVPPASGAIGEITSPALSVGGAYFPF